MNNQEGSVWIGRGEDFCCGHPLGKHSRGVGLKRGLKNPPKLGIYRPYSSARVNERGLPLLTKKLS